MACLLFIFSALVSGSRVVGIPVFRRDGRITRTVIDGGRGIGPHAGQNLHCGYGISSRSNRARRLARIDDLIVWILVTATNRIVNNLGSSTRCRRGIARCRAAAIIASGHGKHERRCKNKLFHKTFSFFIKCTKSLHTCHQVHRYYKLFE